MPTTAQPGTPQTGTRQTGAVDARRVEDALSLIAPKWTTWVVQTLARNEPMRVRDIGARLPLVSRPVLSKRLARMHSDGLVTRGEDLRAPYQLTGSGTSLSAVHQALAGWSHDHFPCTPGSVAGAQRVEDALRRLHLRHTTAVIQALDDGPMRLVHLSEAVGLDDPYTRQRLIRLHADGLVTRTGPRHGDPYTLTAAGRALGPLYAAAEHWNNPTAATRPATAPVTTATRTRNATPIRSGGIRTAEALHRSPAAPSGLFSHAPQPQPGVPAAITAQSAPARGR